LNDTAEDNKTKVCPMCKKEIDDKAQICPYCRTDLSVGGNIGKVLSAIGVILTLVITVPLLLLYCGGCGL
jgi:hypothetical protein